MTHLIKEPNENYYPTNDLSQKILFTKDESIRNGDTIIVQTDRDEQKYSVDLIHDSPIYFKGGYRMIFLFERLTD